MADAQRMLVVIDPTAARQPALERAVAVAPRLGLRVELLIAIHGALPGRRLDAAQSQDTRRVLLNHQLGYLRELAKTHAQLGIGMRAVWDRPLHEAIIRETLRMEPRLVMKDTHYHAPLSRALFTNTDWHLVRDCPAPLWLVRDVAWPPSPVIGAFVDPMHEQDAPAELDHRILDEATALAERLGGFAHAVHCMQVAALATGVPVAAAELPALLHDLESDHAGRLAGLARAHGVPPARTHLRSGAPAEALPAAARELQASIAVMGAVARSRLQQAFLGSTAEKVLDQMPCDVLVVKPAKFESPVTYRAQAADFMEIH